MTKPSKAGDFIRIKELDFVGELKKKFFVK